LQTFFAYAAPNGTAFVSCWDASSKAVFLGVIPLLTAAAATGDLAMIYRAVLIATLLLLTTPISAHAITKAAYQRGEATQASDPADESGRNLPGP
jgi:monovalent cation/proton antiporter MnhG/PhaG subunit